MIDGLELGKMTILAAMGIDGDEKNASQRQLKASQKQHCRQALLEDLIHRGLDILYLRLYVTDRGKTLHKAITDTFGIARLIQRCQVHKKRNALSYLLESEQANVSMSMTLAYREFEYEAEKSKLIDIAGKLEQRQAFQKGWRRHRQCTGLKFPVCFARHFAAQTRWNLLTLPVEVLSVGFQTSKTASAVVCTNRICNLLF